MQRVLKCRKTPPEAPASCLCCSVGRAVFGLSQLGGAERCPVRAAPASLDRVCQGLQCIFSFLQIDSDVLRCLLNKCVSVENQSRTDSRMPAQVPSHGSGCSRALLKVFLQSFFLGTLLWSAAELGKSS